MNILSQNIARFLVAATGSILFLGSCAQAPAPQMQVDYKTMTIAKSNKTLKNNYTATIKGKNNVEIRPQVGGVITQVCINEGAKVSKGQTLFIIDQVPYKAALETAIANVKSAQAKLANAKLVNDSQDELYKADVVAQFDLQKSQNSLLEAQAALAQMQAQETNARNNLSYTEVKSPVNGVASMIPYRVGALVSSSITEPLVTVSDDNEMYAYFSMSESQIINLTRQSGSLEEAIKNMPEVDLVLSDGSIYKHKGKIDAISGTIDQNTGAVAVRAAFSNPEQMLRNGGSGKVVLSTFKNDAIVVPQAATYELQNRVFVYKVVDGKAQSTGVVVFGVNDGNEYVVESGLEVGDVIIADGAGLMREGAVVTATPAAAQAATDKPAQAKPEADQPQDKKE